MKKNSEIITKTELSLTQRGMLLREYWSTLNPEWLRNVYLIAQQDVSFETYLSLIIGLRPAIAHNTDDNSDIIRKIAPQEILKNIVIIPEQWTYDVNAVRSVILNNQGTFIDFDFSKINNDSYILAFMKKIDSKKDRSKLKCSQIGLLIGYPKLSVHQFVNNNRKKLSEYHNYGYDFAIDISERDAFDKKMREEYRIAGVDTLLKKYLKQWELQFKKSLENMKTKVEIFEENGLHFLEIIDPDFNEKTIRKSLVLLTVGLTTKKEYEILLELFAKRYNQKDLDIPKKTKYGTTAGNKYFEFIGIVTNPKYDPKKLQYIELTENYKGCIQKTQPAIDKTNFLNWLHTFNPDAAEEVAKILKIQLPRN